ncbi:hypothetical protein NDU88_005647 [Pleurodeles waltl]|uniref:Uncharacterized protein n=1 Tax=Pleurodeles waltl TaxID=8319 RepID=A0AAV7TVY5_PLEWA|nr:hypothetical protein NDU88_005647 [Pleurodeles waltl]
MRGRGSRFVPSSGVKRRMFRRRREREEREGQGAGTLEKKKETRRKAEDTPTQRPSKTHTDDGATRTSGAGGAQRKLRPRLRKSVTHSGNEGLDYRVANREKPYFILGRYV